MTYRLQAGELEVETVLHNHSLAPLPVSVGYHPYFRVQDAPRDKWKVHVAAKEQLIISEWLVPTGESKPFSLADPVSLEETQLDDVFSSLVRDEKGRAHFWFQGIQQRVAVTFGPRYQIAIVYAPPGREFICIEPMAAVTNAFNLAHTGVYQQLQSIPPGGEWRESFWIRPSGF
jgi:aldose 1-epimerase